MSNPGLKRLQEVIGYSFKDESLLENAIRHSSYANEKNMTKNDCNERLEFLGDAVLELISSEYLFNRFKDVQEGELTKQRASMVCEQTLAICAEELGLGEFLLLGKGEDATGGRKRKSILSDALEAVIGAIYIDGGFANAKEFIYKVILDDIDRKKLFYDSKTILQEMIQKKHAGDLVYELIKEEGPEHLKVYVTRVSVNGKTLGEGSGRNKKASEAAAAYEAILKLRKAEENTCI